MSVPLTSIHQPVGGDGNRGGPADDSDYPPETETGHKEKYYVSAVFGGQTEYGGSRRCNAQIKSYLYISCTLKKFQIFIIICSHSVQRTVVNCIKNEEKKE